MRTSWFIWVMAVVMMGTVFGSVAQAAQPPSSWEINDQGQIREAPIPESWRPLSLADQQRVTEAKNHPGQELPFGDKKVKIVSTGFFRHQLKTITNQVAVFDGQNFKVRDKEIQHTSKNGFAWEKILLPLAIILMVISNMMYRHHWGVSKCFYLAAAGVTLIGAVFFIAFEIGRCVLLLLMSFSIILAVEVGGFTTEELRQYFSSTVRAVYTAATTIFYFLVLLAWFWCFR